MHVGSPRKLIFCRGFLFLCIYMWEEEDEGATFHEHNKKKTVKMRKQWREMKQQEVWGRAWWPEMRLMLWCERRRSQRRRLGARGHRVKCRARPLYVMIRDTRLPLQASGMSCLQAALRRWKGVGSGGGMISPLQSVGLPWRFTSGNKRNSSLDESSLDNGWKMELVKTER